MFCWRGLVPQQPELLLGQATPDPEDLPGAHRERPALKHRWTARADCLGQTDPAGPGVGTLGVSTKERPFTHSLASNRRPRLVGPIRHGRPAGTHRIESCPDPRGGAASGRLHGGGRRCHHVVHGPVVSHQARLSFLSGQTAGCRAAARLAGPLGGSISCQTGTASPTSATAFAGCCTPAPAPPAERRTPPTADRPV